MSLLHLLRGTVVPAMSLYVIPHQDDELMLGAAILSEVAAGMDVHVMIMTRGEGSSVRTQPTLVNRLGYTPTKEEFSAARDREFTECVLRMGATPLVLPWADREPDGGADAARMVNMVKAHYPPTIALRATGPTDYHTDHRECGEAVQMLHAQGWGVDHRLLLAPTMLHLTPPGVTMQQWGEHGDITPYHVWPYKHVDVPNGWWGIGYTSAASSLDYIIDTDGASYWHPPLTDPLSVTDHGNGTATLVGAYFDNHANGTATLVGGGGVDNNNGTVTLEVS